MMEMIAILAAPFAVCLVIAALHGYMGTHVVKRGLIFVDLALAQMAALGTVVALATEPMLFCHHEEPAAVHESLTPPTNHLKSDIQPHEIPEEHSETMHYAFAIGFTFIGAAVFAFARFRDERIPHEAIIGIVFVVAAALSVLILSRAPHGHERMEAMLIGNILFVTWGDVLWTLALYAGIAVVHILLRTKFMAITQDIRGAEASGMRVRLWDLLFYATFGLMVTQSVKMGGVLVVFSYLIIPAVCAGMFITRFGAQMVLTWIIALLASVLGLSFSAYADLPTGASLVCTFGALLVVCAVLRWAMTRFAGNTKPV